MKELSDTSSDIELVDAACNGNPAAFEILISRYFGMVHAIAFARLGQREAAEDLAQEAFLRAHLRLAELREPRYFSAWLTRITRNLAVNWIRDEQRRSRYVGLISLDEIEIEVPDPQAQQKHEDLARHEENTLVRGAIFRLDPETREVVLLHYSEGIPVIEIARRLGVHHITVRRHLHKALALLRRDLEFMLGETARGWASPKRATIRTTAIVAGVATLSSSAKSSLAAAMAGDAGGAAVTIATHGIAGLPGEGAIGLIQSSLIAAKAWLAGGATVMASGKAFAVLVVGAGLATGSVHYYASRPGEANGASSTQPQAQVSMPPVLSLPPGPTRDLLEKAEGYAALLNVERVESLTEKVLAKATDPRVKAAAWWTRAMAYAQFDAGYETDKFEPKRVEAVRQVGLFHPAFLTAELPAWEVACQYAFPPLDAARVEELVSRARGSLAGKAGSEPAAAFRLGRTLQPASYFFLSKGDTAKSRQYTDEACRYLTDAARATPDNYEYQSYCLTMLSNRASGFEPGRHAELVPMAERIAKQFGGTLPYPPAGDMGPLYLHASVVSIVNPAAGNRLMEKYVADNPNDAWLQYQWILEGGATRQNKESLGSLVRKMEEGKIEVRGTEMAAMAAAYYKLLAAQNQAGQLNEALATCNKLAAMAPQYANLPFERAVILYQLAEKEAGRAKKMDLLKRAFDSVDAQLPYNNQGAPKIDTGKLRATIQKAMGPK